MMGFAKGSTHPASYRTGLNVGRSGLACRGLTSGTTSVGLVMNQSTHAMAMNAAAASAASPFKAISGIEAALVAEDYPVLVPRRIVGADQRIRVGCDHGLR